MKEEEIKKVNFPYLRQAIFFEDIANAVQQFSNDLDKLDIADWDNVEWKILVDRVGEAYNVFSKLNDQFKTFML